MAIFVGVPAATLERFKQIEASRQANIKAAKDRQAALAEAKAQEAKTEAELAAFLHDSIRRHLILIDPVKATDFPTTDKALAACREILSDLRGVHKILEMGLTYSKFSDLLTEKVLAIEKVKDLQRDGIPEEFLKRVDACVEALNESRSSWGKKIDNAGDALAHLPGP